MTRFGQWLFDPEGDRIPPSRIVRWWEVRRLPFNVIVGLYGSLCLVVFLWAITTSEHLAHGEDAIEPITLLAAPVLINVAYTMGWLIEVPLRRAIPTLSPKFRPRALKVGLTFGLALVTLPAAYWAGYRLFQLCGVVA